MITLSIVDSSDNIKLLAENENENNLFESETVNVISGTTDYNKLNNLPTLDGREIKGNINELDPTVPQWAKQTNKPSYTAHEVGALSEDNRIPLSTLNILLG